MVNITDVKQILQFAIDAEIKVLVNDLFSCQNTSERADLFVARN